MPSNQVTATTGPAGTTTDLALRRPTTESSHTQSYGSGNAVDDNPDSYWESANSAFPQWIQVDLGAATAVRRIVLTLPPSSAWGARTQTISVQGGIDSGGSGQVLAASDYRFDPSSGNTATLTLPAASTIRYVRLTFTANSGWPAAQVSGFKVYAA
ncbi:discoidin domain-containing protein [Streptomyces brevispora]|uniref:discoidin domain-containing protein n=1 Tax=Streptomyces brevispora TaxID=887462 RepID=UPI002DDC47C4|nr:discoidin domain-containing protein [Streptomyces brevispora]